MLLDPLLVVGLQVVLNQLFEIVMLVNHVELSNGDPDKKLNHLEPTQESVRVRLVSDLLVGQSVVL